MFLRYETNHTTNIRGEETKCVYLQVTILEDKNRKKSNEKLLELKIGIIARKDINILIYQITI